VSTNGVSLHFKIEKHKTPVKTRTSGKLPLNEGNLVNPSFLAGLSEAALSLLRRERLANCYFWEIGFEVFKLTSDKGDFMSLTVEQRLSIGDLFFLSAGVDPFRAGKYKQANLFFPLERVGNVCPEKWLPFHLWLVISLREHDPR
jgi:hypothetical protein